MDQKVDLLARLPLFSALDQRSMEAVATLAREVAMPAGNGPDARGRTHRDRDV